ncbi:MAG TPA: hypothetical protein VFQ70_02675 [Candidatus Saccharimonadaceae bacterium]|nr:hypothetical protein [Candidatus Saccharimonadaceae bacterium]
MSTDSKGGERLGMAGQREQFSMKEYDKLAEKIAELLDEPPDITDFDEYGEPRNEGE